jgi:hypothetical protein
MFKADFAVEWRRLNPQYIQPKDGLLATLFGALLT